MLSGIAVFAVMVVLALIAFPYFAQLKGSSGEWRAASEKLTGLVAEYRRQTGRLPASYVEIERLLHPDPEFDYIFYNDRWPHERSMHGTLRGITMRRAPQEEFEGVHIYRVRFPGKLSDYRLYISPANTAQR